MSGRDAARAGVPWGSPTLRVVLASTLVLPLGVPLVSPVLPAIRDAVAVTDATASLLVTVYFLPGIVLSPLVGVLADRVGRRRVLFPALVAFALAGTGVVAAPSVAAVLALRFVQGLAAAAVFVTTVTLIGDAFSPERRNAVLGANAAALLGAAAVYPVVVGALAAFGWQVPFALSLLALPVGLFIGLTLPEPSVQRERAGWRTSGTRSASRSRRSSSASASG